MASGPVLRHFAENKASNLRIGIIMQIGGG